MELRDRIATQDAIIIKKRGSEKDVSILSTNKRRNTSYQPYIHKLVVDYGDELSK